MINTPQELLEFMSDFKYEWMDKDGIFHEELTPDMYENYSLMTPEEVLINKKGINDITHYGVIEVPVLPSTIIKI